MQFLPALLGNIDWTFNQRFAWQDMAVVGLLVVLEGVLSIDNALVLGLLAKRLPREQRGRALSYGIIGAFVFRFIAVALASFLLRWTFVKLLGGGYLVYIAVKHLFFEAKEETEQKVVADAEGNPAMVDAETGRALTEAEEEVEIKERVPLDTPSMVVKNTMAAFWWTVVVIELTDIAFAVDSIVAAIGVVGSPPPGHPAGAFHPKLWVVVLGGILGMIVMRFAAKLFITLLEKFPRFELSAYLLVIVIGFKLLGDWWLNSDWSTWGFTFHHDWAVAYVNWLKDNWIFALSKESFDHPHVLDFHDPRRPEFIVFWVVMVVCFLVGFVPRRSQSPVGASEKKSD
jgi:YkoY family integral membrane protein